MSRNRLPSPEEILAFIASPRYRPMHRAQLYGALDVAGDDAREVRRMLKDLERTGRLVRVKGNRYAVPADVDLVTGRLQVHQRGFGFVVPASGKDADVYIHGENMAGAMHGDTVAAKLLEGVRGRARGDSGRREGRIVEVLERANTTIVGTLEKTGALLRVAPDNPRIQRDVYIAPGDAGAARPGQKVVVRVTGWGTRQANPEGVVTEVLGDAGEPETDLLAIIHDHKLRIQYPPAALKEARRVAQKAGEADLRGREDLRGEITFTVDPVTAKDFDDAVSLVRKGSDWVLGVHIADVSHYVVPGSPIDDEARARATSVYFPGRVLPMLPEALSNDVCSLRENEDRLTQSAFVTLSPDGRVLESRFASTVIRSRKRFTYARVSALLGGEALPDGEAERLILPVLKEMERLATAMRKNRFLRGAINLDMPEAVIEFDAEGRIAAVRREEYDISHILIEEFMLAANEAVGALFTARRAPALWRVHEEPDDKNLWEYLELIKPFGHTIRDIHDKRAIQAFLDRVKGKPEAYALHLGFLRSLKLAVYSTRNVGHYGLGCPHYLYFTSPIRRYPDLVTHRFLKELCRGKVVAAPPDLEGFAVHCSEAEQAAEDAERECVKLRKLQYLSQHLEDGTIDAMKGVITGIRDFGFSVYLNDYLLDGLVHVSTLTDDFYRMAKNRSCMTGERTRRRFQVGDIVTVQISRVNLPTRQVDFTLAGPDLTRPPHKSGRRRRK
ncbi:MAG: ribonuclease R [Chlamydiota bacterium]